MGIDAAKTAIRGKKKGWFESETGARGWIAGPILCLWNSAFDRYGPMVIATIRADGSGTRITGRAGSDLNGMIALSFVTAAMTWVAYKIIHEGQATTRFFIVIGIVFGLGVPLTLWMSHKDKRQAEPLVRFLRRAVGMATGEPARSAPTGETSATISVNDSPIELNRLHDTLISLSTDDYLIIAFENHRYMQVRSTDGAFIVEKREGGADRHFAIELSKGELGNDSQYDNAVKKLVALMTEYSLGRSSQHNIQWKHVRV